MMLLLLDGEGATAGVELGPEAPPLGATMPGWPGAPSWTSLKSCLDAGRGVVELGLALAGRELEAERC